MFTYGVFIVICALIYIIYRNYKNELNVNENTRMIEEIEDDPSFKFEFLEKIEYVIHSKKTNKFVNIEGLFNKVLKEYNNIGKFTITFHSEIDKNNYLFLVIYNDLDYVTFGATRLHSDITQKRQMFFILKLNDKTEKYEVESTFYNNLEEKNIHYSFAKSILDLLPSE